MEKINNSIDKLVTKTDKDVSVTRKTKDILGSKRTQISRICSSLNRNTQGYKPEKTLTLMNSYMEEEGRLLYSEVSNYIFSLDDEHLGLVVTNLSNLMEFCNSADSENEERDRFVFKFYDHSQLAVAQTTNLAKDDVSLRKIAEDKVSPIYEDFRTSLNEQSKDLTSKLTGQLISLVSIFTALSFMIFGSINSLDNIFQNLTGLPLLKLIILACVWGLGILNIIFVFMYFVSKLTDKDIKTNRRYKANFIQRYPFSCFSNLMVLTVLAICSWLYYIDERIIVKWFPGINNIIQIIICIIGFFLIGFFFAKASKYFINKCEEFQ